MVGSNIEWFVGRKCLVDEGDAEPVEGRSRHFQQLEEAMVTAISNASASPVGGVGLTRLAWPRRPVEVKGPVRSDAELQNFFGTSLPGRDLALLVNDPCSTVR